MHRGGGPPSKKLLTLARLERERPDELRADFQQWYGINIDGMGSEYTHAHAAALAVQLPPESRTVRAEAPALEWTFEQYLLSSIEYDLRVLAWQNSRDGQKGRNAPKPPITPAKRAEWAEKIANTDVEYIESVMARKKTKGGEDG